MVLPLREVVGATAAKDSVLATACLTYLAAAFAIEPAVNHIAVTKG